MKELSAGEAWEKAVYESDTNLNKEDINVLLMLSKMLGQTDVEGQVSQIEITRRVSRKTNKNEKLYSRLGTTIGLAIVIILI